MPSYSVNDMKLKERIESDLSKRLPPEITSHLVVTVVPMLDSNVNINFKGGGYICTFCMIPIGIDMDQYQQTIDYTVQRILDHNSRLPASKKASLSQLVGNQKHVFLFIPPHVDGINEEFVKELFPKILPDSKPSDLKWSIHPLFGSESEQKSLVASVLNGWTKIQKNSKDIKFDQKTITVGSDSGQDVGLTCIIGYNSNTNSTEKGFFSKLFGK